MSKKSNQFSPEIRERAVRMVGEHRGDYPSLWATIESLAPKIGYVPQTLNEWVKRDEIRARASTSLAERHRDCQPRKSSGAKSGTLFASCTR